MCDGRAANRLRQTLQVSCWNSDCLNENDITATDQVVSVDPISQPAIGSRPRRRRRGQNTTADGGVRNQCEVLASRRHLRHGYEEMRRYGCGMRRYECGGNGNGHMVGMVWVASRALNLDQNSVLGPRLYLFILVACTEYGMLV